MFNHQLLFQLLKNETRCHLKLLKGESLGSGKPEGKLTMVKQGKKVFAEKTHWVKFGLSYWTVSVNGHIHDEFTDEAAADNCVAALNQKLGV